MSCFPVNDSEPVLCFPIDLNAPCPGATHATMEEAFTAGSESGNGTRSILDIVTISDTPTAPMAFSGVRTSYPIKEAQLQSIFGTLQPSHAEVQDKVVSGHPVSDEFGMTSHEGRRAISSSSKTTSPPRCSSWATPSTEDGAQGVAKAAGSRTS
ncbi:MAG: hypothetical protein ACI9KE_004172 [Polyangiales bacterium]|jgi:hypothetical protein